MSLRLKYIFVIIIVIILFIFFILDPFPSVPTSTELQHYTFYSGQQISSRVIDVKIFQGRCYITLSNGEKIQFPWVETKNSDLGLWECLKDGDSIFVKENHNTLYLYHGGEIIEFSIY